MSKHSLSILCVVLCASLAAAADHINVITKVDTASAGIPISPYIYGAAMGDRKQAAEMGLTILRAGGNEVTPINWLHGFSSKGADWYFENFGKETPPGQNWLLTFFGENKKASLETYLTMPIMGRMARDGVTAAFDTRKYPNQEDWAGRAGISHDGIIVPGGGERKQ